MSNIIFRAKFDNNSMFYRSKDERDRGLCEEEINKNFDIPPHIDNFELVVYNRKPRQKHIEILYSGEGIIYINGKRYYLTGYSWKDLYPKIPQKMYARVILPKTYYKVVNSTLKSAVPSIYSIQYILDQWVYPIIPDSKLLCFDNLKDVKKAGFAKYYYRVFRCEVSNPSKIKYLNVEENDPLFWKNKHSKKEGHYIKCIAPPGTVGVDSVKLIEEIEEN